MAEFITIARPYAKALHCLAKKENKLTLWLNKLAVMVSVIQEPKVVAMINDSDIDTVKRKDILLDILSSENLDKELENFISILSENKRLSILPSIFNLYKEMVLSDNRIQDATLYTAFPLEEQELKALVVDLEKHLNTKLEVQVVVEPKLIGGIKLEFGDSVLDLSVQNKLNTLSTALLN